MKVACVIISLLLAISPSLAEEKAELRIGSKKFTESVILGEIATQYLQSMDQPAQHIKELGGTRILWKALIQDEIHCYPEYTGTILKEILSAHKGVGYNGLSSTLKTYGVGISASLGFNNTYALGVTEETATTLNISNISDLNDYPGLKLGFTNEFMDREDGWPGLQKRYGLPQQNVIGLDHDIAYRALANDDIKVMDLYSTDADIGYYNLTVLEDDHSYFPEYQAVLLYRLDAYDNFSALRSMVESLEGSIDEQGMINLNAAVKIEKMNESSVAGEFLRSEIGVHAQPATSSPWQRLISNGYDHLLLVIISLSAAIIVALPLGTLSARNPRTGQIILGIVGIIQTIPSLALLVFMIPLLGIGGPPAIVALFLYSLLPIVRNTYTGLHDISPGLMESADALGLKALEKFMKIEVPLALRSILAGIKTSAVINVGTATLGALVGAGGYGQAILTGIRLDDTTMILEGAIPAALLALLVQGFFDLLEKLLVSEGLKIKASEG